MIHRERGREVLKLEPWLLLSGAAAAGCAGLFGGWPLAGAVACLGAGLAYAHGRQMEAIEVQQRAQQSLAGLLHGPGLPEELAGINSEAWGDMRFLELLQSLKVTTGGEAVVSGHKVKGEDQQTAVLPGISATLSHDAGVWYAELTLKGVAARRFGAGGPTRWQAQGETPEGATEALAQVIARARRTTLVQGYAERVLQGDL